MSVLISAELKAYIVQVNLRQTMLIHHSVHFD